jgi:hypothetical protein
MTKSEALDRIENYFGLSQFEEVPEVEIVDASCVRLVGCLNQAGGFAEVVYTYDLSCSDLVEFVSVVYPAAQMSGVAA